MPTAADRAERGRGPGDDEVLAAGPQVDAALLPAAARVGRRLELADEPQLLERGLELRAQHAPFDPLEREERSLDRRPLAFAAEVGAQPGAQVARSTHVQHLVVAIAEEVDAGPRRGAAGEPALVVDPTLARSGERTQLGEPPGSQLLGEPDQVHEHLGRGLCVRQRTVARSGRNAEEVGQRGEADAPHAALQQPARQRGRAERRLRQAPVVHQQQLPLQEALVEARVVRDEEVVAREREETPDHRGSGRGVPQLLLAQAGQACDRIGERDSRIHERLEGLHRLERPHPDGPDLADAVVNGREPRRLQVEDDELGLLERRVGVAAGERDRGARADDAAVAGGHLLEQRAGEAVGDRGGGEERAGGLDRRERPTLLERVHQPVERVECELHRGK